MLITKKHFTKAERIIARILQEEKIPFKAKVKIGNREVDFVFGNIALEIDGHEQDGIKNNMLVEHNYIPIHLNNSEIFNNRLKIKQTLINLWQLHTSKEVSESRKQTEH